MLAAFADGAPGAWIATPLHLRSQVQAGDRVPNCCVVIVSTMPLTQALDRLYEQWQAAERLPATSALSFVVPADHQALAGHFPSWSIVPGALLLDHVLSRLGAVLGRPMTRLPQVRFCATLLPNETAHIAFEAAGERIRFSVTTRRDGVAVTLATGSVLLGEPASTS